MAKSLIISFQCNVESVYFFYSNLVYLPFEACSSSFHLYDSHNIQSKYNMWSVTQISTVHNFPDLQTVFKRYFTPSKYTFLAQFHTQKMKTFITLKIVYLRANSGAAPSFSAHRSEQPMQHAWLWLSGNTPSQLLPHSEKLPLTGHDKTLWIHK